MKRKKILSFLLLSLTLLFNFGQGSHVKAEESSTTGTIELINQLTLYVDPTYVDEEVLTMYESGGWEYHEGYFTKNVISTDETILVDGQEVEANSEGTYEVEQGTDIEVETAASNLDETTVPTVDVDSNDTTTIVTSVNVNNILDNMSEMVDTTEDATQNTEETAVTSLGQSDGERPDSGDIVACNRFNGYAGNGRYYSNEFKLQAIKNFAYSDCDWALGRSVHCYADEQPFAKYRYCSLVDSSHYGKCSGIIGHSKKFHMHSSKKN